MSAATSRRRTLRDILVTAGLIVLAPVTIGAVFLLAVAPPVDDFSPETWTPRAGFQVTAERRAVAEATPVSDETYFGPEDIAIDARGNLYTGDRDGIVWRIHPNGESERFAEVGGRPLGMAFAPSGNLLIANHGAGLQSVSPEGEVTVLTNNADGRPILFANDLDISPDGIIYFTDSSSRYNTTTLGHESPSYLLPDLIEGRATGRLLAYDPRTGETRVLLDELYFPNGVALTNDGRRVWIAESNRYRILEHALDGSGTRILAEDLPGTPDNINRDFDGSMLVALYDRVNVLDTLVLPNALARELMIRLPGSLFVNEDDPLTGGVMVFAESGDVRTHLTALTPAATAAVPHGDRWYLGALLGQPIRWMQRADTA